jgi:hypothetical protein
MSLTNLLTSSYADRTSTAPADEALEIGAIDRIEE